MDIMAFGFNPVISLARQVPAELLEKTAIRCTTGEFAPEVASFAKSALASPAEALTHASQLSADKLTHFFTNKEGQQIALQAREAIDPSQWNPLQKFLFKARIAIENGLQGFKPFVEQLFGSIKGVEQGVGNFIKAHNPFDSTFNFTRTADGKISTTIDQAVHTIEDGKLNPFFGKGGQVAPKTTHDLLLDEKDLPPSVRALLPQPEAKPAAPASAPKPPSTEAGVSPA